MGRRAPGAELARKPVEEREVNFAGRPPGVPVRVTTVTAMNTAGESQPSAPGSGTMG